MVSFWPWRGDDSSPASFEKTLSTLSVKITNSQARLDRLRATARRVKVLSTLYLSFAYLVYAIVLLLVVGWKNMGAYEWSGMAAGPVVIYVVRTIFTLYFNFRTDSLSARLKDQQNERAKTIQKLKDATKYDSTLELLQKYGGADSKASRGKKASGEDEGGDGPGGKGARGKKSRQGAPGGGPPNRTNMPPPPTANIQRDDARMQLSPGPASGPGTPQHASHSPFSTPSHPAPRRHAQEMDASAEFAPNAFDSGSLPPSLAAEHDAAHLGVSQSHWYDRILDLLLGEDETAAKNRIVLVCGRCRLVNGQAPPGTKSLAEVGLWKCMACGAMNGEMDEGKRIVKEVLGQAPASPTSTKGDDEGDSFAAADALKTDGGDSSGLIEIERDDGDTDDEKDVEDTEPAPVENTSGARKRKGKGKGKK